MYILFICCLFLVSLDNVVKLKTDNMKGISLRLLGTKKDPFKFHELKSVMT